MREGGDETDKPTRAKTQSRNLRVLRSQQQSFWAAIVLSRLLRICKRQGETKAGYSSSKLKTTNSVRPLDGCLLAEPKATRIRDGSQSSVLRTDLLATRSQGIQRLSNVHPCVSPLTLSHRGGKRPLSPVRPPPHTPHAKFHNHLRGIFCRAFPEQTSRRSGVANNGDFYHAQAHAPPEKRQPGGCALLARSLKIQRAQSVEPLPLVPAPVSPRGAGTSVSTPTADHATGALESDIHILTLNDFLREQPMDWCVSMNDPPPDKLVMAPSTQLNPESPCSVAFVPSRSPTPLAIFDAHFAQINPTYAVGAAQDRKTRFLETDNFYIKREYVEDPNVNSSSCDSEDDEDKERRRKRQRGYEKAYRVKKREEHKRMRREWIQLESILYSKRAQQAHAVQFKNPAVCTARDRLWQLYQEEQALIKDRIAIIVAGRWRTFFLIQKDDDDNAKLQAMSDWEALSDTSLGMSLTKPFIPPPVTFSWGA